MTTDLAIPRKPVEIALAQLDSKRDSIAAALPQHIAFDKFRACVQMAIAQNPDLLSADRGSLILACMQAAQDGLLLDRRQAALVVYRTKSGPAVQYMPMIAGVLKKLRNSGQIATIAVATVYSGDEFAYELGLSPILRHVPTMGERGRPVCHYAVARLTDGSTQFLVYTMADIAKRRAVSRSQSGPWVSWPEEMAQKTVLRGLCKMLPSSTDIDTMVERMDADIDLGRSPQSSLVAPVEDVEVRAIEGETE